MTYCLLLREMDRIVKIYLLLIHRPLAVALPVISYLLHSKEY